MSANIYSYQNKNYDHRCKSKNIQYDHKKKKVGHGYHNHCKCKFDHHDHHDHCGCHFDHHHGHHYDNCCNSCNLFDCGHPILCGDLDECLVTSCSIGILGQLGCGGCLCARNDFTACSSGCYDDCHKCKKFDHHGYGFGQNFGYGFGY